MPVTITSETVPELSSVGLAITFRDEESTLIAPDTLTWTLTNEAGTVINSREDVAVASPGTTTTIVLSGNDLQILGTSDRGERRLLLEATYTSALGSGLPFNDEVIFFVGKIPAIGS